MSVAETIRQPFAVVFRSVLFLSSYAPLFLILAILLLHESYVASAALIATLILSLVTLRLFLSTIRESSRVRIEVEEIQPKDGEMVSYIATYAIPFLAAPFETWEKGVGLAVFFVVVWFMQVKLNLLYVNPVLAILNYHLYEVTTGGTTQMLLSKKRRGPVAILYAVKVGDNILFEDEP